MTQKLQDLYLDVINRLTNVETEDGSPSRYGLTVTSSGVVYSGYLVSETAWLKSVTELLQSANGTGQDALIGALASVKEASDEALKDDSNREKMEEFCHFVDVSVVSGNSLVHLTPTRILRSSITAWSFGVAKVN